MCRVLILDDELYYAQAIELLLVEEESTHPEIVTQAAHALEKVTQAVRSNKPYDILMIDYRLGPEKDGIEVFKELRAISPDSDGIILTGYDDEESGLRSYKAGAFRYLPKITSNQELLFVFRALRQWREEQRATSWQQIFSEVLESALRKKEFQAVGQAVVQHSLRLGFSRAHLFWKPTARDADQADLVGIECAGAGRMANFIGQRFQLADWGQPGMFESAESVIFIRSESVTRVRSRLEAYGYQPPSGEISLLPLRNSEGLLGVLMLDYGQTSKTLGSHERGLLKFFARQVSLAMEHAALYTREQKAIQEQTRLNEIGRDLTARATHKPLTEILAEVRERIGEFGIDTGNFMAILIDEEVHELDLRLVYCENQPLAPSRRPLGNDLEDWFFKHGKPLLIETDIAGFARRNGIQLNGKVAASWLGIPLRVNGKLIGGLILQQFQAGLPFIDNELRLLTEMAVQVAGAIQNCEAAEKEHQELERLNVLNRAGVEMLRVAQQHLHEPERKQGLWQVVLTIATARFGVGFNDAMLFLKTEPHTLQGTWAIGTEDASKVYQDWQIDEARDYSFDDFLLDLDANTLRLTDYAALIKQLAISWRGSEHAFGEVLETGQILRLTAAEAARRLPAELRAVIQLNADCAILPLKVRQDVLGLLLVDNKHNGREIAARELNRLQTVLNYAGLIWETLREYEKSLQLLEITQTTISQDRNTPLQTTLKQICEAALKLIGADWAVIYPFSEHDGELLFDQETMSYAGHLYSSLETVQNKRKPATNGLTAMILKAGEVIVEQINKPINGIKLANYQFIKAENVKAFFGLKIQDVVTHQELGVFYLNFREPRHFSAEEIDRAHSFASLAAFVISNSTRYAEQEMRRRLEAALATAVAVSSSTEQKEMLKNVLTGLHKFFKETTLCVLTYDKAENSLKFAPGTLDYYQITNPTYRKTRNFPLNGKSLACTVARKALQSHQIEFENVPNVHARQDYMGLVEDTQSELCVSLINDEDGSLLGVLVLERKHSTRFDQDDEALVETVARQLSLGLKSFSQREEITFTKTVSTLTASAADLAHDIKTEAGNIQAWAYLIKEFAEDSLTISDYATQIEESAQRLSKTWIWKDQGHILLPLDKTLYNIAEAQTRQKNIEFEMHPGAPGIYILANPTQIERILRHLVRNADQAMRTHKRKKIILQTRKIGTAEVEILFQDFGPGVSEKVRQSLFKTDVTTKQTNGGYGLLLSRLLVEEMDGTIRLMPRQAQKGAVFSIKLPIASGEDVEK